MTDNCLDYFCQMINFIQIGFLMSFNPNFPQKSCNYKNRNILLKGYSNKRRKVHFLSDFIVYKSNEKNSNDISRLNFENNFKPFRYSIYILLAGYILGFMFNYSNLFLVNLLFNIDKIFNLFNFLTLILLLKLFWSGKKFTKPFLNKIITSYFFLQLFRITENCIELSGAGIFLVLFKIINNLLISGNLWIGKNDMSVFPEDNTKENKTFWQIKIFFSSLCFLDLSTKIFFKFFLKSSSTTFSIFPESLLLWSVFLKKKTYMHVLTDFWLFSTLGISVMIASYLLLLYFVAFVKITTDYENLSITMRNFLLAKFFKSKTIIDLKDRQVSSISNLTSSNEIAPSPIEDLLFSEKNNLVSMREEKIGRWKIKKKGIKTPFSESVWNNELPLLKQNLWYEIKSK